MEILALNVAGVWAEWLRPIILLIVGLGAVIFVHELGHFLVAKMVGIKVERFALGFGPRLFGIRRGETDYCVNLLPLGGYLKMLGQEDIAPLKEDQRDPRAFNNKSVGARFAVISAGVIMNVIFAALLFIIVCLAGIRFLAPVIGRVQEGFPADEAQITWSEGPTDSSSAVAKLQGGDEILSMNGRALERFQRLVVTAALAREGETFRMKIRRTTPDGTLIGTARLGVKVGKSPSGGQIFRFGIRRPLDTVLGKLADTTIDDAFEAGDRVVKIDGRTIQHFWDIKKVEESLDGRPVTVTVQRNRKPLELTIQPNLQTRHKVFFLKDGTRLRAKRIIKQDGDELLLRMEEGPDRKLNRKKDIVEDKVFLDVLGCRPRVKIVGVQTGDPADKAGLKPGDVVLAYGDRIEPSYQQFLDKNKRAGEADDVTSIVVLRNGRPREPIWIIPKMRGETALIGVLMSADMGKPVVTGLRRGSPAQRAGIIAGDLIVKISALVPAGAPTEAASQPSRKSPFVGPPAPPTRPASTPATAPAGATGKIVHRPVETWADMIADLKEFQGRNVTITYSRGSVVNEAEIGKLTKDIFDGNDYRVVLFSAGPRPFEPLLGPVVRKGPLAAMTWGAGETWLLILRTYATLRSLMNRTISHKEVIGPIGMGGMAIQVGRESIVHLIYFMAIISVSLAVINFLPIPVVDGGHAVFLIVEKIRGKPVPVKIMNIVQVAGLALLLFVFVAVTWQDISRLISNW